MWFDCFNSAWKKLPVSASSAAEKAKSSLNLPQQLAAVSTESIQKLGSEFTFFIDEPESIPKKCGCPCGIEIMQLADVLRAVATER